MNAAALVTGASRGIGRGIALELAGAGFDLVINYARDSAAADETANACSARAREAGKSIRAFTAQADISIAADRRGLLDTVWEDFGRLDLLVNNAGIAPRVRADILEAGEESFDEMMRVNVKGPYFLTQLAARRWIEKPRGAPPSSPASLRAHAPKIIFITSISAYTASTNRGDYCLAKAALSMATALYATRLAEFGIPVFEVRPGIIATDMTAPVKGKYDALIAGGLTPIARWGTPEDVGKAVVSIALDAFPFSTGEIINVDGGFHLRRL